MTKRRDILKAIGDAAKDADIDYGETEGANHTVISLDGLKVPVGRHKEIPCQMARIIYKEAEPKLGKDWWK